MSTSEISPASAPGFADTRVTTQRGPTASKVHEFVRRLLHSIRTCLQVNQTGGRVIHPPLPLRKLVPICLDLASTALVPISEPIAQIPSINLGLAAIQGIVSLHAIGRKTAKSAKAIKDQRKYQAELKDAEVQLRQSRTPSNRAHIEVHIQELQKHVRRCRKQVFSLRNLPLYLSSIASGSLSSIVFIAQKIRAISDAVLTGLKLAGSIAGAAAGGIGVILGGIESVIGIRAVRLAYKEKKAAEARLATVEAQTQSETGIPENIWGMLRTTGTLHLSRESLRANKNFQRGVFRACGGSLATVAGALGIGAAFTAGTAATGIAVAALVVGMIGLGVSIASYLQRKHLKSQIATYKITNEQFEALIGYIKSPACTEAQKGEIALFLGIDVHKLSAPGVHLTHEFRKLLCTEDDTKELAAYLCTGKSSLDQKIKFAQIVDKPISVIHDRYTFLEKMVTDCLKHQQRAVQKDEIHELAQYFRADKPTAALKEKVSKILKMPLHSLTNPQMVLENLLIATLINIQEEADEMPPTGIPQHLEDPQLLTS